MNAKPSVSIKTQTKIYQNQHNRTVSAVNRNICFIMCPKLEWLTSQHNAVQTQIHPVTPKL